MKVLVTAVTVVLGITALALTASADNSGRIYGKIYTVDGDVLEGLIRWDKNEGNWFDMLDGTKELPEHSFGDNDRERRRYSDRGKSIEVFGVDIVKWGGGSWDGSAQSGIRFGHIKELEVRGDDEVRLLLKSGQEIDLEGGSGDIGRGNREIVIEDPDQGEFELVWDDIDRIEFIEGRTMESSFGERLYGTLKTRRGDEFTGFICWDVDEIFAEDELDGEDRGRKRSIEFGLISAIERYSSSGATVYLKNGSDVLLRETNDVDEGNRGIIVSDLAFGQVIVKWDEFDRVDFTTNNPEVRYRDFEPTDKIYGTVYTENGASYTGEIVWDRDEEHTWEILDGEYHDIEFDIEFGLISEIKKRNYRSAEVTVSDGRTFRLRGSNDVDEDNKGIYIRTNEGDWVEVDWYDFERVEFARR